MKLPLWLKPLIWGAVGGAAAAMIIGFNWGGWVSGGTALKMQKASAEAAVVTEFTPMCVASAELQPEMHADLKAERSYKRDKFVIEAGWVDDVSKNYQSKVAKACATTILDNMKSE